MFIKSPLGKTYFCDQSSTAQEAIKFIQVKENLPINFVWKCEQNGKFLDKNYKFTSLSTVTILPHGGLQGGKGGFGSLLRSIGAQIEKTTNHEAMRDLSGRRQRDVNNEQRLKNYVAGATEREREAREKKEVKLEKLRRLAEGENKGKHDFSDPLYDKARSETEEKVHEAVEAAMAAGGEASASKAHTSNTKDDFAKDNLKRKNEGDAGPLQKKPKGLWIGQGLDELDDSDLSDSDESSDEAKSSIVVSK
eukprot:GFUD01117671.1.p1 GENE.GFUD01117671.1~~GFUD01117671.1.p1  ORF type:complete len:250 (+),score=90.54 GFUD01117671.1:47-796(+)